MTSVSEKSIFTFQCWNPHTLTSLCCFTATRCKGENVGYYEIVVEPQCMTLTKKIYL